MLTAADAPTIRNAIQKRLGKERGVGIADIRVVERSDCIWVGILFTSDSAQQKGDSKLICKSTFELPLEFELGHLHAEIDEIAEGTKWAKRDWGISQAPIAESKSVPGTGLRGRWRSSVQ